MIISKTPYRVSLFGGGTDHYDYFSKHIGVTVGGSINKYIYISLRKLPVFFKHRFRISWSKIENVKKIENITHPIVRELLKHFKIKDGLEIHYDGDLPGNSGTGSSAAFCVGLIKCLARYTKKNLTKKEIALLAYKIEKVNLKESTGLQDQIYATYGGFSKIIYTKKKFSNIKNKLKSLNKMKLMAHQSVEYIKNKDTDKVGLMLDKFWQYKKKLSTNVTNEKIDKYYSIAIKNGALGGKLIGAGGGGFLLIYAKKKFHKKIIKSLHKLTPIKFNFTSKGSEIIENEI